MIVQEFGVIVHERLSGNTPLSGNARLGRISGQRFSPDFPPDHSWGKEASIEAYGRRTQGRPTRERLRRSSPRRDMSDRRPARGQHGRRARRRWRAAFRRQRRGRPVGIPPTQPPVVLAPPVSTPPAATTPTTTGPAPTTVTPVAEETSKQNVKIHINVPHDAKLRKVIVEVNGKVISVLKGKKALANLNLGRLPCGRGTTTVVVIAVTNSGKTVRQSHKYHLC